MVDNWLEIMCEERVPADIDLMSKEMWELYWEIVTTAARQCPARINRERDHICRCIHSWTAVHNDHRCGCTLPTWTDVDVNSDSYEDGASL